MKLPTSLENQRKVLGNHGQIIRKCHVTDECICSLMLCELIIRRIVSKCIFTSQLFKSLLLFEEKELYVHFGTHCLEYDHSEQYKKYLQKDSGIFLSNKQGRLLDQDSRRLG